MSNANKDKQKYNEYMSNKYFLDEFHKLSDETIENLKQIDWNAVVKGKIEDSLRRTKETKPRCAYCVAVGNLVDGLAWVGPFEEYEDALNFAERNCDEWTIITMESEKEFLNGDK